MFLISSIVPVKSFYISQNIITIISTHSFLLFICNFLQKQSYLQFKILTSISGLDYLNRTHRYEVLYDLLSLQYNIRLKLKLYSLIDLITFPSITALYPCANWWEREIWDLFGLFFANNTDLRRILTDYGFEGFPLRKDFPLSGYLEISYNSLKKTCTYTALELATINKNTNIIKISYNS